MVDDGDYCYVINVMSSFKVKTLIDSCWITSAITI